MSVIAVSIQNRIFQDSFLMMLMEQTELRAVCITSKTNEEIFIECDAIKPDILLMDVMPDGNAFSLSERILLTERLKSVMPNMKSVLLCDEVAYPMLAHEVMRVKSDRKIDLFFYTSVTAEYLIATLSSM